MLKTVLAMAESRRAAAASLAALLSLSALQADPLGRLEIRSLPEVDVVWEGVFLGKTDAGGLLEVEGIPYGGYSVAFHKPGYHDADARIEVNPGEKTVFVLHMEAELPQPQPVALPESLAGSTWEANPTGASIEPKSPDAPAPEQEKPAPVAPARVRPAGPSEAAATGTEPVSGSPWLLLAAAIGGAAVAFAIRRRRSPEEVPAADPLQPILATAPTPKADAAGHPTDPEFLEDLKRREQALDNHAPRWNQGEVIDVEAIEIRPAEEKT